MHTLSPFPLSNHSLFLSYLLTSLSHSLPYYIVVITFNLQLTTDQDHIPVTMVTHVSPPDRLIESMLPTDMLVSILPSRLRVEQTDDDQSTTPSPDTTTQLSAGIVAEADTETAEG